MPADHLERGAAAGVAGGLLYGLFVAFVVNPFVEGLAHLGAGHEHAHAAGQAAGGALPTLDTAAISVGGGLLWGLLAGVVVFGVGFYLLEPALPGSGITKRLALAAAGFLTVSVAPWLVFPPQPPGVEQSLPAETRIAWYAGAMVAGAAVAALCGLAARRTAGSGRVRRSLATLAPLVLLAVPVILAPSNSVQTSVPAGLAAAFRWTVVFGQGGLWATLAAVHAWLGDAKSVAVDAAALPAASD